MKKIVDMTDAELKEMMTSLGKTIEFIAHYEGVESPHFVLMVFNNPNAYHYVSNMQRDTIIEVLRTMADTLERLKDVQR